MAVFVFSVVWTVLSLVFAIALFDEAEGLARVFIWAWPAIGAVAMFASWPRARRSRSLRTEVENGVTIYVWIDLDGRERRSPEDPRPEWDAEGDGDGGDGGGGD